MGPQGGREALTMESNEGPSSNSMFRREQGCFLGAATLCLLALGVVLAVAATGVIVYFFTDRPYSRMDDTQSVSYDILNTSIADRLAIGCHGLDDTVKNKKQSETKTKKITDVRLPKSLTPIHYLVRLQPFVSGNFSIHGHVEMTFDVIEATPNVTLHINDIVTKNDTIKVMLETDPEKKSLPIQRHMYDKEREFYTAKMQTNLEEGKRYIIEIDFIGYLNKNLDGFYQSSYTDEQKVKRWLAVTQFQPTDARKAFPCMDEPGLKASFTIELARQANMTSLSNMPIKDTIPIMNQPGWFWDRYEKSVNMSTYLVAFVVSDFGYLESTEQTKYKFKVWARKSALSQADYAIRVGPPASQFFEKYFNVPFPLPKQDMIALPDFSAGAMENWGLITYRETGLLYDPASTPAQSKMYLASVIVHELAHQWFGNLVTPEWWTDLWLNEGFASYMEYVGTNAVEPTWRMMDMVVVMDLQSVFALDCLQTSHPINIPVHHPDQISEIFDRISYLKGSSIIRMMSHFLTEDTFRRGLSQYLLGMSYKSAVQDDLWRYLTDQAHKDGTLDNNMTVKTIMDTWTLQMGYPVISVTRNSDGTITLKQERFLLNKSNQTQKKDLHDYKWWVPITYSTENKVKQNDRIEFASTRPKLWMAPTEETKVITGIPTDGWVIFNNQETGYYRVNYDEQNWQRIIDQLLSNHKVIHPSNRAQIIDDAMSLAQAGLFKYKYVFKMLSYLKKEDDYIPWKAALGNLGFIQSMFSQTGAYGALKEFYLDLILPTYNKLGFEDSLNDPHLDQLLRSSVLSKACDLGYTRCIDESYNLFKRWMSSPNDYSLISPNLKSFVYCTAIKRGGYEEWTFLWNRYQHTNVGTEKRTILGALGCSKEVWILNGYINRAITDGRGIRKQDARTVITSVSNSAIGPGTAWQFLKDKWPEIRKYFGSVSFTLTSIVKSVTSSLNTGNNINEMEEFVRKNEGKFGSAERAAMQALENAKNNLLWMNNNYQDIVDWLKENNYTEII